MTDGNQGAPVTKPDHPRYILRRIVIITVIIIVGIVAARQLIKTKPKVSKRQPERIVPLVKVVPLQSSSQVIRIGAMGTVIPSKEIVLKTPVGGEIKDVNDQFSPGGIINAGDTIIQIDPRDYELALQMKERALSDAQYAYKLEEGRQNVARQEWDLLYGGGGENVSESDLALRKPHLKKVEIDIKSARADVDLAKLDLTRTAVKAPFNGMILNKYVDKGSFVAPQEKLADIVGTDEYWVQVSLPQDRLQWLQIPRQDKERGSPVRIVYRKAFEREGRVIRLMGDLSKEGRMARLLVSVQDPLGLSGKSGSSQPLLIGEYVRAEIEGEKLQDVFRIPRTALHNDREIWIVTKDSKLEIHAVETVWRNESHVFVRDGLQAGDLLVVSNLAVPVDGMMVRIDQKTEAGALSPLSLSEEEQ